jgi:hypothetical protein
MLQCDPLGNDRQKIRDKYMNQEARQNTLVSSGYSDEASLEARLHTVARSNSDKPPRRESSVVCLEHSD